MLDDEIEFGFLHYAEQRQLQGMISRAQCKRLTAEESVFPKN